MYITERKSGICYYPNIPSLVHDTNNECKDAEQRKHIFKVKASDLWDTITSTFQVTERLQHKASTLVLD